MIELLTTAAGVYSVARFCTAITTRTHVHAPPQKRLSHIQASLEFRLHKMGFKGERKYSQYLSSPHWRAFKKRIRASRPWLCMACNTNKKILAHHCTYVRIGYEAAKDVVLLCSACHQTVHAIEHRTGNLLHAHRVLWSQRKRTGQKVGPWC